MTQLQKEDLSWCLRTLPKPVFNLLKESQSKICLAGGYIRARITNEKVNDIDLFSNTKETAENCARKLAEPNGKRFIETDNAYTVLGYKIPIQFIHRWTYCHPQEIIASFDFTIAQAAIWYSTTACVRWDSECCDTYYSDLAAKRLVYTSPIRIEEAGGSMLRVLKFYQKGYRIPLDSLGFIIARVVSAIDFLKTNNDEKANGYVISGLLREVDPSIDPLHDAHMPLSKEE